MFKRLYLLLIVGLGLTFSNCGGVGGGTGPAVMGITSTSLAGISAGLPYKTTLQVIGGKAPYTWSLMTGALPNGFNLDPSTGVISGNTTDIKTSVFTIQAVDSSNPSLSAKMPLSITIFPPLIITTNSLRTGIVGVPYSVTLKATGGAPPIQWNISAGSLPAGLTLEGSTGIISGTPTVAGTTNFTISATDFGASVQTRTQLLSMTINPALGIGTTSLPAGTVNSPYSAALQSVGGVPPVSWSVVSGSLPVGLTLDTSFGVISGTPTAAGTSNFTVLATDSSNPPATAQVALSITINAVPLKIITTSLPTATVGSAYSASLQSNGGTPPVAWSISVGSLPAGLTLNASTGVISGTPTSALTSNFTITATDAGVPAQSLQQALSINVVGNGSNDTELNGQYAFLLQGFDASGPVSIVGSLTANGSGAVSGIEDVNRTAGFSPSVAFTGTYSIGADQRGAMTITSSLGTSTFAFSLGSIAGAPAVAALGHVVELDTSGTRVTGVLKRQDATAFTLGSITGNYVMGMTGGGNTSLPYGLGGTFTADGLGAISAGNIDTIGSGLIVGNTPPPIVPQPPPPGTCTQVTCPATFTGTYTAPTTNGRGTATLTIPVTVGTTVTNQVINEVFYVISANEMVMMGADVLSPTTAVYAGSVLRQAPGPYALASLNGSIVFHTQGFVAVGASQGVTLTIGILTSTGIGTFSYSADGNKAGVLGPNNATGVYSVAPNGRVYIADNNHAWDVYLTGPNQGFLVDTKPGATTGLFEAQAAGPFTNASLSGNFIVGDEAPSVSASALESGVSIADGVANVTGTTDQNNGGVLTLGAAISSVYTVTGNGRVVLTTSKEIMYIVSPSRALIISSDPTITSPNLRIWEK